MKPIPESLVLLLVEEIAIANVLVRVVAGELLWGHLLVGVAEVDVAHVIRIVQQIRVECVVVPEVVLVVLARPVPGNHEVQEAGHASADVRPEDRASQVEPGVDGSEEFVVGVRGETSLVRSHVRERLLERDDTMLHEGERAEPEESDTRASEGPPMPVKVHLDVLVEDTVATLDGLSVHTLSEISDLLRQVLDLVKRLSRVRLVEGKEPLGTCSR